MLKKSSFGFVLCLFFTLISSFAFAKTDSGKLSYTSEEKALKLENARIIQSNLTSQDILELHRSAVQKAKAIKEDIASKVANVETYLSKKLDKKSLSSYDDKILYLINSKTELSGELVRFYVDNYVSQLRNPKVKSLALQYLGYGTNTDSIIEPLDANLNFSRPNAKAYAETYAENPNLSEYPYYSNADCANFASQVLQKGGMAELGTNYADYNCWFCNTTDESQLTQVALTWRAARYFRRHWGNENGIGRNRAYAYTAMTVTQALQQFDNIYWDLWEGDVIQYGDPNNYNYPYHTQVVHAYGYNPSIGRNDLFMAQHTSNVKNVSLYQYLSQFSDPNNRYIYIYEIKDSY